MKKFFKSLKLGMMFSGLFSVAVGILLLLKPGILTGALSLVLGGGLLVFGIAEIVSVFARPNGLLSVGRMIPGILCVAVGLVFLLKPETFLGLIWVLMGIAVLIDAVYKLQYAFELKAASVSKWWINLLFSLFTLVFGVVLILDPMGGGESMIRLAGALLLVNGLFDLSTVGMMSAFSAKIKQVATVLITDSDQDGALEEAENESLPSEKKAEEKTPLLPEEKE